MSYPTQTAVELDESMYEEAYDYGAEDFSTKESSFVPLLIAFLVGSMACVQGLDARLASFEKIAYAGLFGVMLFVALLSRFRAQDFGRAALLAGILILPAIPIAFQPHVDPVWVMGDMIILLAPVVLWLLMKSHPGILDSRNVNFMLGLFYAAAIIAPLFANATEHGRFEPPRFLLFAAGWYCIFRGQRIGDTLLVTVATFILLGVTWFSDVRVAVLLWFAAGAITAVSVASLHRFLFLGSLGVILVAGLLLFAPTDSKLIEKSRFAKLDLRAITQNDFVRYRVGECKEVLAYCRRNSKLPQVILGHGFGASYPSNGSHLSHLRSSVFRRNTLARKVNEHGFTHILHFGPARVMFRYGIVGMGVYLTLGYFIISDLMRLLLGRTLESSSEGVVYVNTILLVTMFCFLVRFHLKNVEHDLDFAFVVAAYLCRRDWFRSIAESFDELSEDRVSDEYEVANDFSTEYV